MKKPLLQDDAFLADVSSAETGSSFFHLWWLGQSGFLIKYRFGTMVVDPYLSDALTRKYAATDKPHTRVTARVVDPSRLAGVDVVTSSHNHTDHLDADTLLPLIAINPELTLVASEANTAFVRERLNVGNLRLFGIHEKKAVEVNGFTILGVPAAHNDLDRDRSGYPKYLGFLIWGSFGTIYHSGDTRRHDEIVEFLRAFPHPIDLALLPINGDRPERRVAGNLSGREAAQLAKDIGAKLVIPCHYDMFEFNTADPADEFIPECERLGQPYRVLQQGERFSSTEIPA
jgi:L-ascorbate metabolism protein UlaG (beta-lactamase superfamily)